MTNHVGLSHTQAKNLLRIHGANTLINHEKESFLKSFLQQFIDPMMLLLIGASILIFFIGDPSDAYLITGILLFNACVGTFQERKINNLIDTVENHETEYALVIRDTRECIIKACDLVPGDYIIMQQGEQVHADVCIIHADNLLVNEAVITGEQYGVMKKDTEILYKGSFITTGIVHASVIATGRATRIGKLQAIAQQTSFQTPLQKDLAGVIKIILGAVIAICLSLLVIGIITQRPFAELFAAIIALFICVVPQGLPVIMTLILASNAFSLLKKQFFVKKMSAVDGLARSQVIIFDKTGTLTTNQLSIHSVVTQTHIYSYDQLQDTTVQQTLRSLFHALALLEQPHLHEQTVRVVKGNATDAVLCTLVKDTAIDLTHLYSSYLHTHATITLKDRNIISRSFIHNNDKIMFMMGAPEQILKYCTPSDNFMVQYQALLDKGLRVIAVAQKQIKPQDTLIVDATLLGFIAIVENIRTNAAHVIKTLQQAGIQTMIATGDKKETALFIAQQTGIVTHDNLIIDGTTDFENHDNIVQKQLFYRMTPEKKIALIKALQARNLSVAMIGDGFNDAPAVAAADTGIALGARAADVTKQAASALLLDDGFEHLVAIISRGRHVFMSFKRVILYFFTTNFSEILIVIYSFYYHLPLPLLAPHILWLNLITDGFLDSSLALEPHNKDTLEKGWFNTPKRLVDTFLIGRILYQSILVTTIAAHLFSTNYGTNLAYAQTLCMAAMTLCQCAMAINCRSFDKSLFTIGLLSNRTLSFIVTGIVTGLIIITSTTWGNATFKTVPLNSHHWIVLTAVALGIIVLEELRKQLVKIIG